MCFRFERLPLPVVAALFLCNYAPITALVAFSPPPVKYEIFGIIAAFSPLFRFIRAISAVIRGAFPLCPKMPRIYKSLTTPVYAAKLLRAIGGRGSIPPLIYAKTCVWLPRRCPFPLRVEIL